MTTEMEEKVYSGPVLSRNLETKIRDAMRILDDAINQHLGNRTLVAKCVLFSGGNDSSTLIDLMVRMHVPTHAIHANTTIGIEGTRQFVRDRCADLGLPLLEYAPDKTYRDHVMEKGFPGPGRHQEMYDQLKDRGLRKARRELVSNGYRQRVLFIAGRRREESKRRADIPETQRIDSVIWASPLANWTRTDLDEYREQFMVPRNPIADALGMSGECLCGAFAEPGELERIAALHPDVAAEIQQLEIDVLATGKIKEERCMWGWGAYRADPEPPTTGMLCSSCDFRSDPAKRAELTPAVTEAYNRILARRAARQ